MSKLEKSSFLEFIYFNHSEGTEGIFGGDLCPWLTSEETHTLLPSTSVTLVIETIIRGAK